MRRSTARIEPLSPSEATEEQTELLAPMTKAGRDWNVFRTMAQHPKLMKRWMVFANHVLAKSTLPPREREMAILRTGWNRQSGYEWAQHIIMGADEGLTSEEIQRIKVGPTDPAWSDTDRALLVATDQLCANTDIDDAAWGELEATWSQEQIMDLVFAVGQYTMVSMALNAFGVQLDPHLELDW